MLQFHALGVDLSLNHAGFVRLNADGSIASWGFVTSKAAAATHRRATLLPAPAKGEDKQLSDMKRLAWWRARFRTLSRPDLFSEYVGIEDYAFGALGHAHATGELGGIARLEVLRAGAALRLHDPSSVKLFATGRGDADAMEVVDGVYRSWGVQFAEVTQQSKRGGKPDTLAEEDLCAAYTVARMVHTEVLLRDGALALSSLPEHQIRVFNRVTKANPVNVLGREFLYLPRKSAA